MTQIAPKPTLTFIYDQADDFDDEIFIFPASYAQQRLWFLDQLEPGSPFYNIPAAVRLRGALDTPALQHSLDALIARHETLRTTFALVDGHPVQVIAPSGHAALPLHDLRDQASATQAVTVAQWARTEARTPFDLAQGPLLRATLLRLADDEHVLLLTLHHIITDGWSMGVLVRELATLYAHGGQAAVLEPLPIQYADYAAWQHEWLERVDANGETPLQRQLAYWREHLAGVAPLLELPTDRPRPAVQSSCGASITRIFPLQLADAINALSRSEHTTLFMALLAAFQVVLARYSSQDDFCIGTPIANRTRAEVEGLIGFFVNTLALRADLSGNPSFRELLQRVRATALGAYAHQDVPFEALVEHVQPQRDLSYNPLFQVMFILQNAPMGELRMPGLTLELIDVHSDTATFDITLSMVERVDGLCASVEYNTDLFDAETIEQLLDHFQNLLAAVVADPDQPIERIPLLSADERRRLLHDWAGPTANYPLDRCVHQLFEMQALSAPDAVAVIDRQTTLTYGELNSRANQLACYLRARGAGPGALVGVCVERSAEMIVAVLAVLKSGSGYLPLDPSYPAERLAWMLEDARPVVVLEAGGWGLGGRGQESGVRDWERGRRGVGEWESGGDTETLDERRTTGDAPRNMHHATHDTRHVDLAVEWAQIAEEEDTNLVGGAGADDLAYVIYTSGSTGQPKGVMVAHRSLTNAYFAWEEAYGLRDRPLRHLQMASFSFDVFAGDLVRALCSGGALALCPRDALLDPPELYALMRREQVDCAEFVPIVLRGLAEYLETSGQRLDFMRLLICGSDSWCMREYGRFRRLCGPQTRLINSFGLTEATIDSTYFEQTACHLSDDQLVPIGRPFANTNVYILDRHLQPTPIGVPGELYIGGVGLAQGYLNRPELTAERFVDCGLWIVDCGGGHESLHNPQSTIHNRVYKTGDRARYLRDGNIEFLGRADHQVKIRGFRIELDEVAAAIMRHTTVQEAVVTARDDGPGGQQLVAYVVPCGQARQGIDDLRCWVQEQLPSYMVPALFIPLAALPMTPNGKIDRRALPAPDWTRRAPGKAFVAPQTPEEQTLAAIWAQALGIEHIGRDDHFFELGGHSLLGTQLISRVRETWRIDLPLRALFESPTLSDMARRIATATHQEASQEAPILRISREGELPLSYAQQRLWFLDQLDPDTPLYNIPDAVRMCGQLDSAALERSLNEVARRHETLRTTFPSVGGKPVAHIAPQLQLSLPITDLRGLADEERETEARRLIDEEARRPFNLARGPLVRAALLRLANDEHILLLTMHHIISDGWSTGVLVREVAELYAAFAAGRAAPLPELPIQYVDFAAWQRQWLQNETLDAQLDYWRRRLDGATTALELPTDRPRPAVQSPRGAHLMFALPAALSEQLNALSRQENATLFMTLLAAFQILLHRYSGQDDITVGTPIANRTRRDIEELIGCFINTLALRGDLSGAPTFRELLGRAHETALEAYAHQDVPFEMVVDAVQPERDLSRTPLFQAMFILQNTPVGPLALPGLTLQPLEIENSASTFDLTLTMEEGPNGLRGALEYCTDLFDASTAERMMRHFQILLEGITADPDRPIAHLPLFDQGELKQILVDWNATQVDFSGDWRIHRLFEEQAARTPDAVAVILPPDVDRPRAEQLTYAELNARANQLARYLHGLGVGPEALVGVCLERSLELIVAVLGVLKAGGAYLPLDPSYPAERLTMMLEDARPLVVLGDREQGTGDTRPTTEDERRKTNDGRRTTGRHRTWIDLNAAWDRIAQEADGNPAGGAAADDLAYVIYTSGSTGRPKGVMVTHHNVANAYKAWESAYGLRSDTQRHLQMASFSFDVFSGDLARALCSGGALVLCPRDALLDPPRLYALMRQYQIDCAEFVPAVLRPLMQHLEEHALRLDFMRLLVCGSDSWSVSEYQRLRNLCGPATRLINSYGLTETTIDSTYFEQNDRDLADDQLVPIGRPFANTQLYILDTALQPVPIGVPGELYIGGAGVARGYLNRPELTAERFVDCGLWIVDCGSRHESLQNPQSTIQNRVYKTGDRARYRPDGVVELLGRVDHQVKLRGFRIELGEIEAALGRHPAVQHAVALVHETATGSKRLVAYVVPTSDDRRPTNDDRLTTTDQRRPTNDGRRTTDDRPLTPDPRPLIPDIRAFLRERLPDYMNPSAYVVLDSLPLTPNGKIDRKALPAPELEHDEARTDDDAPRSAVEDVLAGIWANVLGLPRVGLHDNFFELGGDSILSIQVIAQANQAGLRLTPRNLFQAPTVAELAALAGAARVVHTEQGSVEGPVLLTPVQRWFFAQQLPEPQHWNQSLLLTVRQPLERDLLMGTIARLLTHHDALRLRFNQDEGGWRQFNAAPDADVPLAWFDLSDLPEAEHADIISATAADLQDSLNLTDGPLLRAAYFQRGAGREDRLLLIIHHLAVDGVSWRILLEDLQTVYAWLSDNRGDSQDAPLPPKTTSFQHWSQRLHEYAQSDAARAELEFWSALTDAPGSRLPVDIDDGANTEASTQRLIVSLSEEETRALLQETPHAYHTEINDVLLTALARSFALWSGSRTLLIELEGHGREELFDDVDISRTVGWFTTAFPVRLDLGAATHTAQELMAVKEQLRRIPNRGIGYGLLRYLNDDPAVADQLRSLPQAEVSFNYLGQMDQALAEDAPFGPASEAHGPDCGPHGQRSCLIEINGGINGGRLSLEWSYSANMYRHTTIARVADDFIAALRDIIAHCQSPDAGGYTPSDFPDVDLSQDEIEALMAEIG
jgi:amino acid adenylation domain-containing protein/non-ribosomal peptide synthase protein (TIGR01720 family)